MRLHEYQGKELLGRHGISLPEARLAYFPDEAWLHSMQIGFPSVLKAQILAGGRGKAGGVRICQNADEVRREAADLFGRSLATKQTATEGITVRKVLVEKAVDIRRELYVSLSLDRELVCPVIVVCPEGGADIESVGIAQPEKIRKIPVNPYTGYSPFHTREISAFLGLDPSRRDKVHHLFETLYRVFMDYDCLLLELNPLAVTVDGDLVPVDVKMDVDDNALFRQRNVARMRDLSEQDMDENEARFYGLNFIKLRGTVGCMVNGAGLAMATMDFVKMAGGDPANFLDVGGVATPETIAHGFRILARQKQIRAIFVNIFGGIVRCDKVAQGIADAARSLEISVPVIIRLSGSNVAEGVGLLKSSGLNISIVSDVQEATRTIAAALAAETEPAGAELPGEEER